MRLVNIHTNGRNIYLFCRDKKGELQIIKETEFWPYYYEPDENGKFNSFVGTKLRKVYTSNPFDIQKNRSMEAHEADLFLHQRYMMPQQKAKKQYRFLVSQEQPSHLQLV